MNNFLALVSLEVRLTLRSKLFWLLAILAIIFVQLTILTVLLIQLMLIHQFTRDERANFTVILNTLPYTTASLYLARAIAALTVLLSLWPFMLANLGFLPEGEISLWLFDPNFVLFLTQKYFIVCFTQVGVILLFSMVIHQLPWLYLLSIVFGIKSAEVAGNLSLLPSFVKLFVFGQGFMLPSAPSQGTGFFPEEDIFAGFALFHTGITLLLIVIAIAIKMRRRSEPVLSSKLILASLLLALIALYSGGNAVFKELAHRNHGYEELLMTAANQALPETTLSFAPESYNLTVKLKTADHYLDGTAIIKGKVIGSSGRICFTLRDCFTVNAISNAVNGDPLAWSRTGSLLTIYLPENCPENSTIPLSIAYSGEVWEWFPDRMAQPNGPVNFIAPTYSLLRSGYAWYPTPGRQDLYTHTEYINPITNAKVPTLHAKRIVHTPLPFTLTVDTDTEPYIAIVASNLEQSGVETLSGEYHQRYRFYSDNGHDIFLISGPYERQMFGTPDQKISVYCFPMPEAQSSPVISSLAKLYNIYDDLLQEKPASGKAQEQYTVVEIPPFLLFSEDRQSLKNITLTDSIVLSENCFNQGSHAFEFLNEVQKNKRDIAILQHWLQEDLSEGTANNNITTSLCYYLLAIGLEKTRMPGAYLEAKQNVATDKLNLINGLNMPFLPISPVTKEVFLVLDTIRSEMGEQTLKKVTRHLYRQYKNQGTIHVADFSAAVNTVLIDTSLSPEKIAEVQDRLGNIEKITAIPVINHALISFTAFSFDLEEYLP